MRGLQLRPAYLPVTGRTQPGERGSRLRGPANFGESRVAHAPHTETFRIPGTKRAPLRIGLGTWAIGSWMCGGKIELDQDSALVPRHRA